MQQLPPTEPEGYDLFTDKSLGTETSAQTFQRIIHHSLGISVPIQNIISVYDYVDQNTGRSWYIHYAEVMDVDTEIFQTAAVKIRWFSRKEILKMKSSQRTSHDITISERVIRARADRNDADLVDER